MKILFLFLSLSALAQTPSQEEVDTYLEAVKDIEIEQQIGETQAYTTCKNLVEAEQLPSDGEYAKADEDPIKVFEICAKKEFQTVDDEQIQQLAENLNLKAYNKKAAKSATSIREYLQLRMRRKLQGLSENQDPDEIKNKLKNYVGHDNYYQLYAEQIGKNTLLEVSKYCFENFYVRDKKNILRVTMDENGNSQKVEIIQAVKEKADSGDNLEYELLQYNEDSIATGENNSMKRIAIHQGISAGSNGRLVFFQNEARNIKESQVCSSSTKKACGKMFDPEYDGNTPSSEQTGRLSRSGYRSISQTYKSVNLLTKLKEAEYNLATKNGTIDPKDVLRWNYMFCATSIIKNNCEIYKCNSIYKGKQAVSDQTDAKDLKNSLGEESPEYRCLSKYNIRLKQGGVVKPDNTQGSLACAVMDRLSDYRKVLAATKKIIDENQQAARSNTSGFNVGVAYKGTYQSSGQNSIDKITTIGSQELVDNVDSLKDSEGTAEELRQECLANPEDASAGLKQGAEENKKCKILLAKLNGEDFQNISENQISKAEVQKKALDRDMTEDELMEFLKKNGMSEYYFEEDGVIKGKFASMQGNIEELREALVNEIETKKNSTLEGIKARFYAETRIKEEADSNDPDGPNNEVFENQVVEETIADVEKHRERVQTLFEYSNLVSSYLTLQDETGAEIGSASAGREAELANQDNETVQRYFLNSAGGSSNSSSSSSTSNSIDYLDAIDQVIGVTAVEEDDLKVQQRSRGGNDDEDS